MNLGTSDCNSQHCESLSPTVFPLFPYLSQDKMVKRFRTNQGEQNCTTANCPIEKLNNCKIKIAQLKNCTIAKLLNCMTFHYRRQQQPEEPPCHKQENRKTNVAIREGCKKMSETILGWVPFILARGLF